MKKLISITIITILLSLKVNSQTSSDKFLKINWPTDENWHVANQQKSNSQTMTEFLKDSETFDNFTEIGTTYIFKGSMLIPIKDKIEELYNRIKKNAPSAKMTMLKKDEKLDCRWFIYKIESPTESQIWYAVEGKTQLNISFWGVRASEISKEMQVKWTKIFSDTEIDCSKS